MNIHTNDIIIEIYTERGRHTLEYKDKLFNTWIIISDNQVPSECLDSINYQFNTHYCVDDLSRFGFIDTLIDKIMCRHQNNINLTPYINPFAIAYYNTKWPKFARLIDHFIVKSHMSHSIGIQFIDIPIETI